MNAIPKVNYQSIDATSLIKLLEVIRSNRYSSSNFYQPNGLALAPPEKASYTTISIKGEKLRESRASS